MNQQQSRLIFFVAWRYVFSGGERYLNLLIMRMSILGMSLGVALLILVLSITNGFEKELHERILAIIPHISFFKERPIDDWKQVSEQLLEHEKIMSAVPFTEVQSLLVVGERIEPAMLYGVGLSTQQRINSLVKVVGDQVFQRLDTDEHPNPLLLGRLIAERLRVKVGNKINVVLAGDEHRQGAKVVVYHIVGMMDTGTELDNKIGLVRIEDISALAFSKYQDSTHLVGGLHVTVSDLFSSYSIARQALETLPAQYKAYSWEQTYGTLHEAILTSRNIVFTLVLFVLLIAAFNILSSLMIMSAEKTTDVAIFKTLGATHRQLFAIFVAQGMSIGVIGSSFGAFLGIGLSSIITPISSWFERFFHIKLLSADIYPIDYIPSSLSIEQVLYICIGAVLLSTISSVYPALLAMRIEPAKALQYS